MRFMMFMYPGNQRRGVEADAPRTCAAMSRYNEELRKAGMLLSLDGLHPPGEGARVSFSDGKATVTDGPFAEAKEVVGGYWLIQARSKEEAVEWASRCPGENCTDRGAPRLRDGGLPAGRAGSRRAGLSAVSDAATNQGDRGGLADRVRPPVAGLARMVRDVGLAEDLAQDALVAALERWPESGVPDNPGAWLMATAKNRAIDLMRRDSDLRAQAGRAGPRRRHPDGDGRAPTSRPRSTTRSATTCSA